jgi:hypothetical protein
MQKKSRSLYRHRRLIVVTLIVISMLVFTLPAAAITFGQPDGNAHPFVGSMVARIPGQGVFQWCSGTLFFDGLAAGPILLDGPSIIEGARVTHLRYTVRRPGIAQR